MRILIAGICGFVGSALALDLRKHWPEASISGIDNFIRPGSETNRPRLLSAGIPVSHADLRSAADVAALPASDWVIDAAATPSVLAGVDGQITSRQLMDHNVLGTINILEYCRRHGAGMILLSTSRVYNIPTLAQLPVVVEDSAFSLDSRGLLSAGVTERGINESFSTTAPISLYGASKLASEILALEYASTFSFPLIVNRCGVICGPRQFGTAHQGVFSYWPRAYAARRPLSYTGFNGSGHQVRDLLHPDDLAALIRLQIQAPGQGRGQTWNVGGGVANAISLAQLSRWCEEEFGTHKIEVDARERAFDAPWIVMDSAAVASTFGWQAQITVPNILREIATHHREHPDWLTMTHSS